MRKNKAAPALIAALILQLLPRAAYSYTLDSGTLTEDFTTVDFADFTQSTGFWNVKDGAAEAAPVVDADAARRMDFGDGSDGVLDSAAGYSFDTDARPDGYRFPIPGWRPPNERARSA